MEKLLFATGNKGKLIEAAEIAAEWPVDICSPEDVCKEKGFQFPAEVPDPEELADNYHGNAKIKAEAFSRWSGLPAFGDDAGLEVDFLDGAPGLYSARYAGVACNSKKNIDKLLVAMKDADNRSARFRSVICMVTPDAEPFYTEATLEGEILRESRGQGGFGYDPLFLVKEYGKTVAELKEEGFVLMTHRLKAMKGLFSKIS